MAGLRISNLELAYRDSDGNFNRVLEIPSLAFEGEQVLALMGPSGSGKTSLLHLMAGLEKPKAGTLYWDSLEPAALSESERDLWRYNHVGMIFQDFHLLSGLSVLGSVLLPLSFRRIPTLDKVEARARAGALIARVGLKNPDQPVETLSRGEAQRVAIARALLRRPSIILADEPTASLDTKNEQRVFELLVELAHEHRSTLVVATHNRNFAERADAVLELEHGRTLQSEGKITLESLTV